MRPTLLPIVLALACGAAAGQSADAAKVLSDLSRLMTDARADPAKAKAARCPANAKLLAGLPVGQVLIELGQPNGSQDASALNYVFSGQPNASARAGAAMEMTFRFNAQGTVSAVECKLGK